MNQILVGVVVLVGWLYVFSKYNSRLTSDTDDRTGYVVAVTDGDTIQILSGYTLQKIRLADIDAPEKDQSWGTRAWIALIGKVFLKTVVVKIYERDMYGRLVGTVWHDGRNINRELVLEGHAWVYHRFLHDRSLLADEEIARSTHQGLWSLPAPIPPWDWRRQDHVLETQTLTMDRNCGYKRYCIEMDSCREARFYHEHCRLSRLDGDSDGIPCEKLCKT